MVCRKIDKVRIGLEELVEVHGGKTQIHSRGQQGKARMGAKGGGCISRWERGVCRQRGLTGVPPDACPSLSQGSFLFSAFPSLQIVSSLLKNSIPLIITGAEFMIPFGCSFQQGSCTHPGWSELLLASSSPADFSL